MMEHITSASLNKLVLLDSSAIIHRAYHGLPPLTTKDGVLVNAVYGFITTLFKVIDEFKPKYIAACFDEKGPTVRHLEFKEYKAHRPKAPDDLIKQFSYVKEICKALNIPILSKHGYEADDVIGTIVHKIQNPKSEILNKSKIKNSNVQNNSAIKQFNNLTIVIVTGDMDTLQLIDDSVSVYSMSRGIKKAEIYDSEKVKERYGFEPMQLIDYKALRGDPSDNIPGVPGIGEKTATNLIKNFQNIENIYDFISHSELVLPAGRQSEESHKNIDSSATPQNDDKISARISNTLKEYKDQAFLSKKLATIIKDVPIDFDLSNCLVHDYDKKKAEALFRKLEFKSLINRLPKEEKNNKQTTLF
jgi:DNA polymerase-1